MIVVLDRSRQDGPTLAHQVPLQEKRSIMRVASTAKLLICSILAAALLGGGNLQSIVRDGVAAAHAQAAGEDASPHRSAFVAGDDIRLNYLDWGGDGPPLILIHGIANSPHIFDDLAPLLRDRFHVIAYARRGHGQSEAPAGPYDSKVLVSDLVHLLDNLGIERANFLGWSMGGNEVTEFAGSYPERVAKIVYLEGGYDWSDSAFFKAFTDLLAVNSPKPETLASFGALKAWYHSAWIGRDVQWTPALEAFLRDAVRIRPDGAVDPIPSIEVFGALVQTLGTWRRDYAKVRAPALAIYGSSFFPADDSDSDLARKVRSFERDVAAPFRSASIDRIRRELRDVRIAELDDRTHMSVGVIAPQHLADMIGAFLQS
jgi:pimeloyl-ACP methyl ester carboxylesterase